MGNPEVPGEAALAAISIDPSSGWLGALPPVSVALDHCGADATMSEVPSQCHERFVTWRTDINQDCACRRRSDEISPEIR
jgi:hypothetical protein